MNYQLIRSNRRTVSISVNPDGGVLVRAPKRVSEAQVAKFVAQKQDWIAKHRQIAIARKPKAKEYKEGEKFLFLGKEFPLLMTQEYRSRIYFENAFYVSLYHAPKVRHMLEEWYKDKAMEIISEKAKHFAKAMGAKFTTITMRNSKTRWGSCSTSGSLNFSWRLIMAPLPVVEYVVIHELAHTLHHNHSERFWKLVGKYFPEFKKARQWLNDNGHKLVL